MAVSACCLAMSLVSAFVYQNLVAWARASSTDCVKLAIDVTSCTIHVQTNYLCSFWWHYSSKYKYTLRTTILHRSEYEANTRYIPSSNFDSSTDNFVEHRCLIRWEPKRWSSFDGLAPKTTFMLHSCLPLALWLTCTEPLFTTMRLYRALRSYGPVLHFGKWKHPLNVVHVLFNSRWPASNK